jgi:aryl-alcohol dehydrogenase-like predicted oxidoreductase
MEYHQLGKSTLHISCIGFGTMSLEEHSDNTALLHKAIDLGINFFDTADLYQKGLNEEMVGKALKEKRKDILIASKVGNQWKPDGSGWDWNPRKDYILSAVEKSLERLQTDYIDLYQLHGGTLEDPIDETIEAFELLQQQGKIRYYGISSIRPNVIREYIKRSSIVSVMMQYSLLDRRPEEECLSLLKQNNIGVLARGSIAKGLLADKPATAFLNYTKEEVAIAAAAIQKVSGHERTTSQTAIRFVLDNPAITSAIIGIRTQAQLENAVGAINAATLSSDELKKLASSLPTNYYEQQNKIS